MKSPKRCLRCPPAFQLVDWARQRFYQEASKPEERITLAKACMLIALEEEAAAALQADQMDIRQSLSLGIPDPLTFAPTGRRRNTSRYRGSFPQTPLTRGIESGLLDLMCSCTRHRIPPQVYLLCTCAILIRSSA